MTARATARPGREPARWSRAAPALLAILQLGACGGACGGQSEGAPAPPRPSEPAPRERPTDPEPPAEAPAGRGVLRAEPGPPEGGVDELPRLHGRAEADLVTELGEPDHRREFTMADCCTEFTVELLNTYPAERPENADVPIRELTWDYDGYHLTVWLHRPEGRWIALDTIRYSDGVDF